MCHPSLVLGVVVFFLFDLEKACYTFAASLQNELIFAQFIQVPSQIMLVWICTNYTWTRSCMPVFSV